MSSCFGNTDNEEEYTLVGVLSILTKCTIEKGLSYDQYLLALDVIDYCENIKSWDLTEAYYSINYYLDILFESRTEEGVCKLCPSRFEDEYNLVVKIKVNDTAITVVRSYHNHLGSRVKDTKELKILEKRDWSNE